MDAMLESMTAAQYREWLAFFKIRCDREKIVANREGQRNLSGDVLRAMQGYQKRQEKANREAKNSVRSNQG